MPGVPQGLRESLQYIIVLSLFVVLVSPHTAIPCPCLSLSEPLRVWDPSNVGITKYFHKVHLNMVGSQNNLRSYTTCFPCSLRVTGTGNEITLPRGWFQMITVFHSAVVESSMPLIPWRVNTKDMAQIHGSGKSVHECLQIYTTIVGALHANSTKRFL